MIGWFYLLGIIISFVAFLLKLFNEYLKKHNPPTWL